MRHSQKRFRSYLLEGKKLRTNDKCCSFLSRFSKLISLKGQVTGCQISGGFPTPSFVKYFFPLPTLINVKERWKMNKYIQHNQKWKNEERQRNRQKEKKPTVMKNGTWRARQDTKLRMRQLKYSMTLQRFVSSCNPLFYLIKLSCLLCFMVL